MELFHSALAATIATAPKLDGLTSGSADAAGGKIAGYACAFAEWLFVGAIIFSIAMALVAAITYMRSSGDPGKVREATNRLVYVAVGIAVSLVAFLLPQIVAGVIGTSVAKVC